MIGFRSFIPTQVFHFTRLSPLIQITLPQAQPKGLFGGLRERGVGGSRCGATAAAVVFLPSKGLNQ